VPGRPPLPGTSSPFLWSFLLWHRTTDKRRARIRGILNTKELKELLEAIRGRQLPVEEAVRRLSAPPVRDIGHSRIDTHRELRCGHPEVVYGAGKSPAQLVEITRTILADHTQTLVTRCTEEGAATLVDAIPAAVHHPRSGTVTIGLPEAGDGEGLVIVVSAGTSDGAVAEEASITARMLGARVEEVNDVGVAGLHRVLESVGRLRDARSLVVVAGMEGALPSVVGGLVDRPVIAVPTSVGYGASFGGLAALLAMLNSCAAGISVVNIDNGFGAGYQAALINREKEVSADG
jgi:pyridinium-3,5-biscarboxylic acid mononucleotide synthase